MTGAAPTGVIHVHSEYSHDCRDSLERLRQFALEHELGFVALTDHAEDLDPRRFDEYVAHCRALSDERVRLIPGLEFRFAGFPGLHLLAIGLRRWITPQTPDAFIAARDAAAFTVVAHPVLFGYRLPASVAGGIDAIEIWNASYNTRYLPDPGAIRMLRAVRRSRPDVVGTVGLDQHDSRNYRQTHVIVNDPRIDPLAALKTGRFTNAARTMTLTSTVEWDPIRLVGLTALRWAFDRVERVHERLARRSLGRRLRAAGRPVT